MVKGSGGFRELVAARRIRCAVDPWNLAPPPQHHLQWNRIAGMLVGLAVGDALGNTSESQTPAARRARHGEIRDYLPNWYADYRPVGLPSDDTQLAFWTLEHLLENGSLAPALLVTSSHRAASSAWVRRFVRFSRHGIKRSTGSTRHKSPPAMVP